jgi:pyruvate/2-oxoglutarate dehydrogenase complex dihydrolipoamide acyltransferase (E2) component
VSPNRPGIVHRIIDGATGRAFMAALIEAIEAG